jgi:hypothetical protein
MRRRLLLSTIALLATLSPVRAEFLQMDLSIFGMD